MLVYVVYSRSNFGMALKTSIKGNLIPTNYISGCLIHQVQRSRKPSFHFFQNEVHRGFHFCPLFGRGSPIHQPRIHTRWRFLPRRSWDWRCRFSWKLGYKLSCRPLEEDSHLQRQEERTWLHPKSFAVQRLEDVQRERSESWRMVCDI